MKGKTITNLTDWELEEILEDPQQYAIKGMAIQEYIKRVTIKDNERKKIEVDELYNKTMNSLFLGGN